MMSEKPPFCIFDDHEMILDKGNYICPTCGAAFDES